MRFVAAPSMLLWLVLLLLSGPARPARATSPEVRVAVLYFENHTSKPELDQLGKGLADMMITDLGQVSGLTIVERSRLEQVLGEQKLQRGKFFDAATAVKVGKLAGARYAVTGALTAVEPALRVDMRMIDIQSSKVVVSEKVVGNKDDFFALEQSLVQRFANALAAKLPNLGSKPALSVDAALAYGQALDLADKGDLQAASKRLGETVAKAPDFQLAQTRYQELLARLYAAQEKRQSALGGAAKEVADKVESVVRTDPRGLKGAELKRWFAYAYLRGNMFLKALSTTLGEATSPFKPVAIPAGKTADIKRLVGDWLANHEALLGAMEDARKRKEERAYESGQSLDHDDEAKVSSLKIGMNPHHMTFAEPQVVLRDIGEMLCLGKSSFFAEVKLYMAPTPWELNPAWQKRALTAFERAVTDIEQHTRENIRVREAMRTYSKWGDCLLARGRKVEGVMRWQTALEKYPASEEFADIETKVKEALKP
jgi:TolB-like protein